MNTVSALVTWLALVGTMAACSTRRAALDSWLAEGAPTRCTGIAGPVELALERALPLDVTDDFQPSGLALAGGRLFTVSDKHDDAIYEIELSAPNDGAVRVRPFIRFGRVANGPQPADLEGLALDTEGGGFVVSSEARNRVLRVTPAGVSTWATVALDAVTRGQGLLRTGNAGIEGVARLPNGGLLLAAEREPRGLIELPGLTSPGPVLTWALPDSSCPAPAGRPNDFADLASWGDSVFALERNAHVMVRLERAAGGWVERDPWSYGRAENDPQFAYEDREFGLAEGLALDERHVFIVLDNNGQTRANRVGGRRDQRPLLFIFRRPPPD